MQGQIIAVCGERGIGKTVFSALLARTMINMGMQPLLLIDGDPTGNLALIIGDCPTNTIADVRDKLLRSMRHGEPIQPADQIDYLLTKCLLQRSLYSLLAIGQSTEETRSWPPDVLLGASINTLVSAFAAVLIDGEAGTEPMLKDGMRRVNRIIAVIENSQKSLETLGQMESMANNTPIYAVIHASQAKVKKCILPENIALLGTVPNNRQIQQFCASGRSLWELPADNVAVKEVRKITKRLISMTLSDDGYNREKNQ
jgi:CO dehydrogenase maturation factor